ncbi:MAG: hypothetical protein ACREL6_04630 [Gemmatimonadales bacterium]
MTDAPRDWDKELADIDRLIEKGGGTQPASPRAVAPATAAKPVVRPAASPPVRKRGEVAFVWLRVVLGVALGAAMTQWPYAAGCGTGLFLFLGAGIVVVLAGLWAGAASWRGRIGLAHAISMLVLFWGLLIVAHVILPRIGYLGSHLPWGCG